MKILHVVSAFGIDFPGGITNYVRTLAASQAASGDEVHILDGSASDEWTKHPLGFRVKGSNQTRARTASTSLSMKADAQGSRQLVREISGGNFDVVHFHLTLGVGTDFYSDFSRTRECYLISLHDYHLFCPRVTMMDYRNKNCGGPEAAKCSNCIGLLDQVQLLQRASRKTGITLPRLRSNRVAARNAGVAEFVARAAVVLAVSTRVRDLFASAYPDAKYDVCHIGSSSATVERPGKVPSSRLRLTFLGTLAEYKGALVLEELVRGVTRQDIDWQFFGRASAKARRRVARSGVQLRGAYSADELPEIMSTTDVGLVLPIWEDNAPQVAMEFVNFGVPVVATGMGGIPDFIDDSNGFVFDPRTAEGVASAVRYIDQIDVAEIRRLGEALPRLTSPEMHARAVRAHYLGAMNAGQDIPTKF